MWAIWSVLPEKGIKCFFLALCDVGHSRDVCRNLNFHYTVGYVSQEKP